SGNGAGGAARSRPVLPGPRRAGAAAVLGAHAVGSEDLHVLQPLAHRAAGRLSLRPGAGHQSHGGCHARPDIRRARLMLLQVRDLNVTLPDQGQRLHAVRGIDLDVAAGETLCLVGESGCGKSMTALALMQLLPRGAKLAASELRLGDLDLASLSEKKLSGIRGRRISMIFQEPMTALNPVFTIGDQLRAVY